MKKFSLLLISQLLWVTILTACGSDEPANPNPVASTAIPPSQVVATALPPTPAGEATAITDEALQTFATPTTESDTFFNLLEQGNTATAEGRFEDAIGHYQQALAWAQTAEDQRGISTAHRRLGIVYHTQRNYPLAIDHYQQAADVAHEIRVSSLQGNALRNLGIVYFDQGDFETALTHYAEALAVARQPDARETDPLLEGDVLQSIGKAQHLQGELLLALESYNAALDVYTGVNHLLLQATTLRNIGIVYQAQGNNELALQNFNAALELAREIGNPQLESELIGLISSVGG